MRLSKPEIQKAILHPDLSVRVAAVQFFSHSFSDDASVMPLIIEAIEKYGRENSVHLVGEGERLPQTESTIKWCLDELRRDFDEDDETLSDYGFAVAKILAHSDRSLTLKKEAEVLEVLGFMPELWSAFTKRVALLGQDAETVWRQLEDFCEEEKDTPYLSEMDIPHAHRLVESLARGGPSIEQRALPMLEEDLRDSDNAVRSLMHGFVIRLAGEMRLKAAVPALVELLKQDDEWLNEECERALTRIGGDDMTGLISHEFPTADWHFRLYGATVLEHTHSDLVVEKCLELFDQEKDETIKVELGQALLAQFATEAIEPIRQFILQSTLDPEILDLRETLIAVSNVLGTDFPEREKWNSDQQTSREQRRRLFAEKYGLASQVVEGWNDVDDLDENYSDSDEFDNHIIRASPKIGRNDPCPCGSGKKYKKCCMNKSNGDPMLN
jgi:SEC-C motif